MKQLSRWLINNRKNQIYFIFIFSFVIRMLFWLFTDFNRSELTQDSHEYLQIADKILALDFNFDVGRFLRSPLYPFFISLHKVLFGAIWEIILVFNQAILSSFSCVMIYKLTEMNLRAQRSIVPLVAGILACIYLPTFFYVNVFGSETLYQFLCVTGIFYFSKVLRVEITKWQDVVIFSLCLCLAYLTRTEIILFFIMMVGILVYRFKIRSLKLIGVLILIFVLITLPIGIINKRKFGSYVTSSDGAKYVFYLANSELGYADAVATPPVGSKEFNYLTFKYGRFNPGIYQSFKLPPKERQSLFLMKSIEWIRKNPNKFLQIRLYNLFHFFSPGLTPLHFPAKKWLISFLFSLPVHVLFYLGFVHSLKRSFKDQLWFIGYFVSTVFALTFFLYTSRYRSYSIEIMYLPYAADRLYHYYNVYIKKLPSHQLNS